MAGGIPVKSPRILFVAAGVIALLLVALVVWMTKAATNNSTLRKTSEKIEVAQRGVKSPAKIEKKGDAAPLPQPVSTNPNGSGAFTYDPTNGTVSESILWNVKLPDGTTTKTAHVVSPSQTPNTSVDSGTVTLSGRTLEMGTGLPVSGVAIVVTGDDLPQGGKAAVSGEDGTFSVAMTPQPGATYLVEANSVPPFVLSNLDQRTAPTAIVAEDIPKTPLDFYFEKGSSVRGIVKWANGEGIASAAVHARLEDKNGKFFKTIKTGRDGRFELPIPRGSAGDLVCSYAGSTISKGVNASPDGTPSEIEFIFETRCVLTGRVITADGDPVGNIRVNMLGSSGTSFSEMADATGTFVFNSLTPGKYLVNSWPGPDSDFFPEAPVRIELTESERTATVILKIVRGDSIDVIVVDNEGAPIVDAIAVWQAAFLGKKGSAKTDAEGKFVVSGIPPNGTLANLVITHEGYQTETRRDLHMLDGPQRIVMEKSNNITLVVKWKEDNTPVTAYAYQLLKSGWNDFEINAGMQKNRVMDPEGRTTLKDIVSGKWRIEVTVLEETGAATTLRESSEFTLEAGVSREVLVTLAGGRAIDGYVTLGQNGPAVAGATVRFEPPSQLPSNAPYAGPPEVPLSVDPVTTDAGGRFHFDGIPVGRHVLAAEKEGLVLERPYDLILTTDTKSEDIHLVLQTGAEIYGVVRDNSGNLLPGTQVQMHWRNPNGGDWFGKTFMADEDGNYSMTGLTPGLHQLNAYMKDHWEQKDVDVVIGERKEVNFGLAEGITIHGRIFQNGTPAQMTAALYGPNTDMYPVTSDGDGNYSTVIGPGIYYATLMGIEGQGQRVTVAESPPDQTIDLNIDVCEADVVLVFPDDSTFAAGQLTINPRQRISRYQFTRVSMTQASHHIPLLLAGEYQATFASKDGLWQGDSGWLDVTAGADNTFTIDVKKIARGVRVGGWVPNQLTMQYQTLSFDVTSVIESGGTASALMRYEKGRHAVAMTWVALLQDGREIDRDVHDGWSGVDQSNNNYRLQIPNYEAGRSYQLQISIRGDGGSDTQGSVYLSLN